MEPYLKIDEKMTPQERCQQNARRRFKEINPAWDDTMVIFSRLFGAVAPPRTELLDLGCGRGNVIVDDHRATIKTAIGIDADEPSVAGNQRLDKIVIGNIEQLPFADASFDMVISQWVIEHLERPDKVFAEVMRVLKPGGYFLFVTPDAHSSIIALKRMVGSKITRNILRAFYGREEKDTFKTFYRANTARDLLDKLARSGFKEDVLVKNPDPSYWSFNNFVFNLALLAERLFPKRLTMHLVGRFKKE